MIKHGAIKYFNRFCAEHILFVEIISQPLSGGVKREGTVGRHTIKMQDAVWRNNLIPFLLSKKAPVPGWCLAQVAGPAETVSVGEDTDRGGGRQSLVR